MVFLRAHGLDVVHERGLGITDAVAIADVSGARLLEFGLHLWSGAWNYVP